MLAHGPRQVGSQVMHNVRRTKHSGLPISNMPTSRELRHRIATTGRLIGGLSAVASLALLVLQVFFNPYGTQPRSVPTQLILSVMFFLALAAAWGAWRSRPAILLIAFVGSFVPVGLYLLGTPGIFRWVGVANLMYLVSAGLLLYAEHGTTRRGMTPNP